MTADGLDRIANSGTYVTLVGCFPPRPIRTNKQLAEVHRVIERLMGVRSPTKDQLDFLELLATLAEDYESQSEPTPRIALPDLLRHLIDSRGVSQAEVSRDAAVSASTLSDVLAGRRGLSVANLARLAKYFGVESSLLLDAMVANA